MKTVILKQLKRPTKRSGEKSVVGKAQRAHGFVITNVSAGEGWYIDRVTKRKKKASK
jgi:hypothetical protein